MDEDFLLISYSSLVHVFPLAIKNNTQLTAPSTVQNRMVIPRDLPSMDNYQSHTTHPPFPSSPSHSRAACSSPNPPPAPIYQGNKSKTNTFYKAAEQFRLEGRSQTDLLVKAAQDHVQWNFKYLQGWWFLSFSGLLPRACITLMGIFGVGKVVQFLWNWIHFKSLILLKLDLFILIITRPWLGVTDFLSATASCKS